MEKQLNTKVHLQYSHVTPECKTQKKNRPENLVWGAPAPGGTLVGFNLVINTQ